ncbi:MAG: 3-dehydroquinate synthase, partial [Verrucomicrobiae bacterium]|nr:3-dehydroquinate synthase [Verrucomicrobiae bacterium]
ALVKDRGFFEWIEENAGRLARLERDAFENCVERSALLHARHIAGGGDPFETGSSRPLDFGHWAAHKLEALSGYSLSHARAVSIGVALDTMYSVHCGMAPDGLAERVLAVLRKLGLPIHHPALDERDPSGARLVFAGLDDFREHLGGRLTVLMLEDVGRAKDVHELDRALLDGCIDGLRRAAG